MFEEIAEDLFLVRDAVNVYLLRRGDEAIAVDFGSGAWTRRLDEIGVRTLTYVLLTHGHRDQCFGLGEHGDVAKEVRAPNGDAWMFDGKELSAFWSQYLSAGCPRNYAPPFEAIPNVRTLSGEANDVVWDATRITAIPTPGHTRGALTYLTVWNGRQIALCGDAVHAGGTIHEPYHLEWDHWTGEGAFAAWQGLQRLGAIQVDVLCPSHGEPVSDGARETVHRTADRVMAFAQAKLSVCAGERDAWYPLSYAGIRGIYRVLEGLVLCGGNTYLLRGRDGEGMVVDPTEPTMHLVDGAMDAAGIERLTMATATHYHRDHSDGLDLVRDRYGAEVWLHDTVAEPLADRDARDLPWLPARSIRADRILQDGAFAWSCYTFGLRHFPGQTWWHCAFDTTIDGKHLLFSGDNFQPPSRWNGTGGFCAYNGCRFGDGFGKSARIALALAPELVCNGHGCVYPFRRSHYEKIVSWSQEAERAVRALCPSGDLEAHYAVPRRLSRPEDAE